MSPAGRRLRLVAALAVAAGHAPAEAGPPAPAAPRALLEQADAQRRTTSMRADLEITLFDGGRRWNRTANIASQRKDVRTLLQRVTFRSPADLAGSSVLTRDEAGEIAQWVYIPAFHVVRRIPPNGRTEAYLGTDYFYEDVLDFRWDDYTYESLGRESAPDGGGALEKVAMSPRNGPAAGWTAYGKIVFHVDPARRIIVRQEFFDKAGKPFKRLVNTSLKKHGRYLLWDESTMENLRTGHKTVTRVLRRAVDVPLEGDHFSVKSLKREE